jgi:hypothetical protein
MTASHVGDIGPAGSLGLRVIRGDAPPVPVADLPVWPTHDLSLREIEHYAMPHRGLPDSINAWRRANTPNIARGLRKIIPARLLRIPHFYGQLFLTVIRADGSIEALGLASLRMVTTAGVRYICDDFNAGSNDVGNMKFHGFGTGGGAEAATDTILTTEETTQYVTDNTRPTGSQASATVSANATYTTVGTYSPDSGTNPRPITEHGIFSQAATGAASGANTLLDRSLFSTVNLVPAADSLQATYVLTLNSGG